MQETVTKRIADSREPVEGCVTLCIRLQTYYLNGLWRWDLQSTVLYGSDRMDFPQAFEGTKGIIHPDDLSNVSSALEVLQDGEIAALDFRLITTYGEVKGVSGRNVSLDKPGVAEKSTDENTFLEESLERLALRKEAGYLQQRRALADATEKLYGIGSFAINKSTGEAWYSDGFYRLYGLPPQSLNSHINTFRPFLHHDDRLAFLDAFEAAFDAEAPVHLEYRIEPASTGPRTVRLVSYWSYNSKGQPLFTGILRDITDDKTRDEQVQNANGAVYLHQQVLKFSEQSWNTGYWYLNLVTGKFTYSDNYYRLFGLKAKDMPTSNVFLSLVHHDDRPTVAALMDNLYNQHLLPEAEFRIVRPDGRQRMLKQGGKLLNAGDRLVMVGVVQDVTVQRGLENKVAELTEKLALHGAIQQIAEELTNTTFITWHSDGCVTWSNGFFRLLGYSPDTTKPSFRLLYVHLHPNDVKAFKDAETMLAEGQPHNGLQLRLVNRGSEQQLSVSFHRIASGKKEVVVGVVKNLTKEKVVHRQLADTAQYAETLFRVSTDMLLLTDAENTVVSWNKAAEEKTGLKAADGISNNLFDLFPSLLDKVFMDHMQAAAAGAEVKERNVRNLYLRKGHQYFLTPLKNEAGEVTRVLHVVQDVSKELDLQQQLTERLAFIESLVAASVDRIVVLDRHMNYLYWNRKAEEYYALSKQKVIGHNILEVFPGLRNDPGYAEFRRVLKGETVYLPPVFSEESTEYFETYLIPVKDERQEVVSILWIVHDLRNELQLQQERRRAQAQLEEEHRRLKEAQTIGQVGSFEWKAATDTVYWSDEMYRIHGLEPQNETITLERIFSFFHPDDAKEAIEKIRRVRREACTVSITHRIVRIDGETRFVTRQLQSFADEAGNITHLSGTLQDVTEHKTSEAELLRLKDKLAQQATDKFLMLFNAIDEGFYLAEVLFDRNNRPVDVFYHEENPAALRITGTSFKGKKLTEINPGYEAYWYEIFGSVALTGEDKRLEQYADPDKKWFNFYVTKIGDETSRQIAIVFQDITEKKLQEQRQQFLLKLSDELRSLSDPVKVEETVTMMAMQHFKADGCYYCAIEGDDAIIRRAAFRAGLPSVAGVYSWKSSPLWKSAVEQGKHIVVKNVHASDVVDESLKQLCIQLRVVSFLDVPVMKEGKSQGILCITQATPRAWTDVDIALAEEIAERTWAAVERAKSVDALHQSEEKLKRFNATLERQVAEHTTELQKKLTILQSAEELAQMGSWEYDIVTGDFNWSEGMYRLFDLTQGSKVTPETYLGFAIEEDRAVAKRIVKNLAKKPQSFEETMHIRRSNETRLLRIKGSIVTGEDEKPQRIVGVDLDITDIQQAKEKAAETKHWLQQTALASPDAICVYDLQKKHPVYLNDCLATWLGTTSEELVNMGIDGRLQLIHSDDRLKLLHFNELLKGASDGTVLTLEYRLCTKQDSLLWLRNRSKVFQRDKHGVVTHTLSILQDVTEEKSAAQVLENLNASLVRKNAELETKNDEITSFAFVASHDLKEPLRKIHTFSDWLLTKETRLSETGARHLQRMSNAVKRLDQLIDDILDLTKVHVDNERQKKVDLGFLLQRLKGEMSEKLEKTGAVIEADALPTITGAENQLFYLFKNLISNAIKFQPPGNKPHILIRTENEDDFVKLSFTDNGIGIAEEFHKKIFEMFRRLHGRAEYEGTGMGLAICKKIMEKHGGKITVNGEEGKGARFTCWFPALLSTFPS